MGIRRRVPRTGAELVQFFAESDAQLSCELRAMSASDRSSLSETLDQVLRSRRVEIVESAIVESFLTTLNLTATDDERDSAAITTRMLGYEYQRVFRKDPATLLDSDEVQLLAAFVHLQGQRALAIEGHQVVQTLFDRLVDPYDHLRALVDHDAPAHAAVCAASAEAGETVRLLASVASAFLTSTWTLSALSGLLADSAELPPVVTMAASALQAAATEFTFAAGTIREGFAFAAVRQAVEAYDAAELLLLRAVSLLQPLIDELELGISNWVAVAHEGVSL